MQKLQNGLYLEISKHINSMHCKEGNNFDDCVVRHNGWELKRYREVGYRYNNKGAPLRLMVVMRSMKLWGPEDPILYHTTVS